MKCPDGYLRKYERKKVRLIDVDGDEFIGRVGDYIFADDDPDVGIESIILDPIPGYPCKGLPFEFYPADIQSIEIIE